MLFKTKPKRILIVEDELYNHPLYREAFTKVGFEVIICQNADDDFIGEVVAFSPDIISMDLMIAKVGRETERDGFAALTLLKSDPRTESIPVIILSNFFQAEKIAEAKKLGAIDYINLQGISLPLIAAQFKSYVDKPKKYKPSHPDFK